MQVGPQQLCYHTVFLQPGVDAPHDLALVSPAELLSSSQDVVSLTNSAQVLIKVAVAQHLQNESALHVADLHMSSSDYHALSLTAETDAPQLGNCMQHAKPQTSSAGK